MPLKHKIINFQAIQRFVNKTQQSKNDTFTCVSAKNFFLFLYILWYNDLMLQSLTREQKIRLTNILTAAGLQEKEVPVYLALLSLQSANVTTLSKESGVQRTSLYFILDRLIEKGFASVVDAGKIRSYYPVKPESILIHFEEKQRSLRQVQEQIKDVLPLLTALPQTEATKPNVSVLKGLPSVKNVYYELLKEDFIGWFNPEVMYREYGMTMAQMLLGKDHILRGRDLLVDSVFTEQLVKDWPQTETYQYRLLPEGISFGCDVVCWKKKVALFSYDKEHTTVIIENDKIAEMYHAWFELHWKNARY